MMEGAGFEVVDLGVDVDSEKFVKTAAEKSADVIALSALLDHDHAVHGEHGQGGQGGGHGHAHDHRGCAGDPGVCRPDRRRRLQRRRAGGSQAG